LVSRSEPLVKIVTLEVAVGDGRTWLLEVEEIFHGTRYH
jgi:hypothetical protein